VLRPLPPDEPSDELASRTRGAILRR
jgi:hypothetical protein